MPGTKCWADEYVIDEARRNIHAKAPLGLAALDDVVSRLHVSTFAPAVTRADAPGLPEKDRIVLAAAAALACDVLVTGDRTHFGKFYGRDLAGVRILSPRSLYERLFPRT